MREAPSEPTTDIEDAPEDRTPPNEPAEGSPDMNLPGADYPTPESDREGGLPQRLGERIEHGPAEGIVAGEPDLLPNVDVPEAQM